MIRGQGWGGAGCASVAKTPAFTYPIERTSATHLQHPQREGLARLCSEPQPEFPVRLGQVLQDLLEDLEPLGQQVAVLRAATVHGSCRVKGAVVRRAIPPGNTAVFDANTGAYRVKRPQGSRFNTPLGPSVCDRQPAINSTCGQFSAPQARSTHPRTTHFSACTQHPRTHPRPGHPPASCPPPVRTCSMTHSPLCAPVSISSAALGPMPWPRAMYFSLPPVL